jgi:hypothetical protein
VLLADNTALDEALTAQQRSYRVRLLADWAGDGAYAHAHSDLSGAVERLNFALSADDDLPKEVKLVQGFSFGSLRATLVGDVAGTPVTTLFSTYVSSSPFYGEDLVGTRVKFTVTVDTASGPVVVPQSRGVLRSVSVKSEARRVDIEVLDLTGAMYAQIDLPISEMSTGYIDGLMFAHTNTQWVVDHVLRANGIYATPPPPDGAVFSATGHGGVGSEIGVTGTTLTSRTNTTARWVDSRWPGMLATPASWGDGTIATTGDKGQEVKYASAGPLDDGAVGRGFAFSGWFFVGGTMTNVTPAGTRYLCRLALSMEFSGDYTNLHSYDLDISDTGLLRVWFNKVLSGVSTSTIVHQRQLSGAESWRYIGIHVGRESSTLTRVTSRVAGVNASDTFDPGTLPEIRAVASITLGLSRSWSNVQAWPVVTAPTGTWPGEDTSHVAEADIPVGNAYLSFLPDEPVAGSLEILRAAVGAEYGRFGFDEEGRFAFRPADRTEGGTSGEDRVVTAEMALTDLSTERLLDSVRNVVTSNVRVRGYNPDPKRFEPIFEATHILQFKSPPGTTTYQVAINRVATDSMAFRDVIRRSSTQFRDESGTGFHCVDDSSPTLSQNANVRVLFEQIGQRTGKITVFNNSGVTIRFQTLPADGEEPALRIAGFANHVFPDQVFTALDETSITKYGRRSFGIAPSEWRSLLGPYKDIAGELMVALRKPVTTLADVPMVGDPRDQIGDLHRVDDPDGIGSGIYGLVAGINRTWSRREGLRQTVTYRVQRQETVNTYRTWPATNGEGAVGPGSYVLALEFSLTSTSWAKTLWFYRTTTDINPTQMRIYRVDSSSSGTPVPDTWFSITSSGATGWRGFNLPKPVILETDQPYRVCFLFPSSNWPETQHYWDTGAGANGFVRGPLVIPNLANSVGGYGQGAFISGTSMQFPTKNNTRGDNRWIDITVADTPFG